MTSLGASDQGVGTGSQHADTELATVKRFRLETQDLLRRARGCADRLRRIDLALETMEPDPVTAEALTAERDQLARALAENQVRLGASWDRVRVDRPAFTAFVPVPRRTADQPSTGTSPVHLPAGRHGGSLPEQLVEKACQR